MIIGMITGRSTQQQHIAAAFGGEASITAVIRRIQRFYKKQIFDQATIARFIIHFMNLTGCKLHLAIDRTNWKFGETNINYLVLAVVFGKKCALPLFWKVLPKKGNSNTQERICLLQQFIDVFGADCIASLTADREFIGCDWFAFLCAKGIPFYIRIKENAMTDWGIHAQLHIKEFFKHLGVGETRMLYEKNIYGQKLAIAGTRSVEGELVLVCTNCENQRAKTILKIYLKRWSIETAFKAMKSKGVNLEDTHMTIPEHLCKLLGIIALANTLCTAMGIANQKTIKFKKTVGTPLYSIFQWGFILLRRLLTSTQIIILTEPQPPTQSDVFLNPYSLKDSNTYVPKKPVNSTLPARRKKSVA